MGFLDRLNDLGVEAPFSSGTRDGSDTYGNLNKLRIEFYHLPSNKSVSFKAYLTEWSDNFASKYNAEEVFGRNDMIHTFQGTHREISLSWDVVASSKQEAIENLGRVSLLAQFLYPAYKMKALGVSTTGAAGSSTSQVLNVGTMTKAPLIKVRFANLIVDSKSQLDNISAKESGLLAAMDGLQVTADLDAGVFDGEGISTPKVFKLTTKLAILHQHTLGWDNDRREWLGEGAASGYPYNAWGSGQSTSNTVAGFAPPSPPPQQNAAPSPSGAEAPSGLTPEEAEEVGSEASDSAQETLEQMGSGDAGPEPGESVPANPNSELLV